MITSTKKYSLLTFEEAGGIRNLFIYRIKDLLLWDELESRLNQMGLQTTYDLSKLGNSVSYIYEYAFVDLKQQKSHLRLIDKHKFFVAVLEYGL